MPAGLIATTLGILIFLFIFWKRLREDYASGIIFEAAFYVLLGLGVLWFVSFKLFPGWFFWTSAAGAGVGLTLGILKFRLRFYETLEALVIAVLPWLAFIFLKDSVVNFSLSSFVAFLLVLIIIFAFYYIDTHFREFTWYRSGKIGFAGLATLAIIFTLRSGIALTDAHVLTFTGKFEAIVSGAMAFVCFILIYNLSRKIE